MNQVNRNYTLKTVGLINNEHDVQFHMIMLNFLYFFCEQIETAQEEQDSIKKLKACVEEQSNSGKVNMNLIIFTKTYVHGSFFPSLHRLCFRNFIHLQMGFIDNNCFVESENPALSRDANGPRSNHRLHVSCDAMLGHAKKR